MPKDWNDQRARLREALDVLDGRMFEAADAGDTDLAAIVRERRITLNELVLLGDEDGEGSALDELTARRAKRLADG